MVIRKQQCKLIFDSIQTLTINCNLIERVIKHRHLGLNIEYQFTSKSHSEYVKIKKGCNVERVRSIFADTLTSYNTGSKSKFDVLSQQAEKSLTYLRLLIHL
jgi:hypothetical protein